MLKIKEVNTVKLKKTLKNENRSKQCKNKNIAL